MRVCHCYGVTDRDIREAVRSAAAGCCTAPCALRAGLGCGGCRPLVEQLTEATLSERAAPRDPSSSGVHALTMSA